jgi:hypothetical protein
MEAIFFESYDAEGLRRSSTIHQSSILLGGIRPGGRLQMIE